MEINKKRYNDIDSYFKRNFGKKMIKLPLDGGFTCPNRDGRLGFGGCIYCSERGAGDYTFGRAGDISSQLAFQKNLLSRLGRKEGYLAYFQNFTGTYKEVEDLRALYEEALAFPGVEGLFIGTRADCLGEEVLDLLSELNERTFLVIELGLQSTNEDTITFIKRGYSQEVFDQNYQKLKARGIRTLAHMIVGLPGESMTDYLETLSYINENDFWGIKIHNLYIEEDSGLESDYYLHREDFSMTGEDYLEIVVTLLRNLRKEVTVHRLTGDGVGEKLIYPLRAKDKGRLLSSIDKKMKDGNYYQGDLYGRK